MEEMEKKLLDLLAEICEDDVVKEEPDLNLVEEGLIDSLGYIQLLFELEDRFGIVIAPTEYKREEMDTPAKILEIVKRKADAK